MCREALSTKIGSEDVGVASQAAADHRSACAPDARGRGIGADDVELVITNKITELSGVIVDDRNQPVTDFAQYARDKYADKLSEGVKAMLSKYPTFRVDVYPSHRTMQYPKWFQDNSVKNATACKTSADGVQISEIFPLLAQQMHHCTLIRSVAGLTPPREGESVVTRTVLW